VTVDGDTLTRTRLCRIPNCAQECRAGAPTRGRWANLCDEHHAIAVAKARKKRGATPGANGATASRTPPSARPAAELAAEGFERKARGLVTVGRRLDRAIRTYRPAKAELDQAIEGWREICRALAGEEPEA
jgi:hypothetical protein